MIQKEKPNITMKFYNANDELVLKCEFFTLNSTVSEFISNMKEHINFEYVYVKQKSTI